MASLGRHVALKQMETGNNAKKVVWQWRNGTRKKPWRRQTDVQWSQHYELWASSPLEAPQNQLWVSARVKWPPASCQMSTHWGVGCSTYVAACCSFCRNAENAVLHGASHCGYCSDKSFGRVFYIPMGTHSRPKKKLPNAWTWNWGPKSLTILHQKISFLSLNTVANILGPFWDQMAGIIFSGCKLWWGSTSDQTPQNGSIKSLVK